MNVYRSSPPLPGIFRPSHLLPSAYNPFVPDSENQKPIMQKLQGRLEMKIGRIVLVEARILARITQRVLAQLRESEAAPHKLLTTGMLLVDFNQELPLSIHGFCVLIFKSGG